jgi:ABC-type transport system involved in multi-copper enzyme maturation permease subunit
MFFLGLVSFMAVSALSVLMYPVALRQTVEQPDVQGRFLFLLNDLKLMRNGYASYIWWGWFGNHLPALWTMFALILGWGGLAIERASGAISFTLSLPVSRRRWLAVRFASGAVQLIILAFVSSLGIPVLSRLIGQTYAVTDATVYALQVIAGGMVFLSFAFLLTTISGNEPVSGVIAWTVVGTLWALSLTETFAPYSIYRIMGGESYFFKGTLPWMGLLVSMALALGLLYLSVQIAERQDF